MVPRIINNLIIIKMPLSQLILAKRHFLSHLYYSNATLLALRCVVEMVRSCISHPVQLDHVSGGNREV